MPDNTILNTGAGGDTYASDEVTTLNGAASSGVKVQRIKTGFGIENDYKDASNDFPLPVVQRDAELGNNVGITALRDLTVAQRYTTWGDSIADGVSPEWTQTNANGGTTTATGGEGLIQTSANAIGSARIVGPTINYFPGQVDWVNSAARLGDTGNTGNTRRWGRFTITGDVPQDGFAFELIDTVFYATSFKGGVATRVASTAWTKFATAPYTLDLNYMGAEIRFTANSAAFYINHILRHTASGGATSITNTLNLPIAAQNINTSGATNRILAIRNIGQGRFGERPSIAITNPSVLFRGRAQTFRTLGRAGAAGQKIMSIHNATGSAITLVIKKITVDLAATVAKTVLPPIIRMWKVTVLPTNGTVLTKNKVGGSITSNASVEVRGDASADGTGSATTLTATLPAGAILSQEFAPRILTVAGYEMADRLEFFADTTVELSALEGVVVYLDYTAATQNPITDMWIAGIEWEEKTPNSY